MHPQDPPSRDQTWSADELAALSGLPRRTIRYYIQLGLVDRPVGETRAAHYGWQHLSRLLRIRELTEQGHSLDQIARLLDGPEPAPHAGPAPGTICVQSQVHLAPGLALTIDPGIANLSSQQVRALARDVLDVWQRHLQQLSRREDATDARASTDKDSSS
ncbi:MAG: helix-turn-helix domain-containing protein [Nevskiaceae bacterium]|jgi:DNA-binding transcriptional MerR regulator|nr:helix-turn-helix domain-containing protein [Nevskiaceae bacterium]